MNEQTIQAAWEAYLLARAEGRGDHAALVKALVTMDEIRARMVHEVIRKKFKNAA